MTEPKFDPCETCDKHCANHTDNSSRIAVLESEYKIVENHTKTVSSLSGKFSLLLVIMGIATAIVAGGALYTFTGVANFKVAYLDDRLALHQQISTNHDKNREIFQQAIEDLSREVKKDIKTMAEDVDTRIDAMEDNFDKRLGVIEYDIDTLKKTKEDKPR